MMCRENVHTGQATGPCQAKQRDKGRHPLQNQASHYGISQDKPAARAFDVSCIAHSLKFAVPVSRVIRRTGRGDNAMASVCRHGRGAPIQQLVC